jgi:hypothetical protein
MKSHDVLIHHCTMSMRERGMKIHDLHIARSQTLLQNTSPPLVARLGKAARRNSKSARRQRNPAGLSVILSFLNRRICSRAQGSSGSKRSIFIDAKPLADEVWLADVEGMEASIGDARRTESTSRPKGKAPSEDQAKSCPRRIESSKSPPNPSK